MPKRSLFMGWILLLATTAATGQVWTSFDSGPDGWTIQDVDCYNGYTIEYSTYSLTGHATGGDPNGYVTHDDITSNCSFFSAPAAYLGDKSAYLGGRLEFSLNSDDTSWPEEDVVVLRSRGLVACYELPASPPAPPVWGHFSIPLTAAGFTYGDENGAPVSESDFATILADLTRLYIPAEFGAEIEETVGLDSVRMSPPGATGVEIVQPVRLERAYPNPFNPKTTIVFSLDAPAQVEIVVHDLFGRRVRTLTCSNWTTGRHELTWNGQDDQGTVLASGVYRCSLTAGPLRESIQLTLVR